MKSILLLSMICASMCVRVIKAFVLATTRRVVYSLFLLSPFCVAMAKKPLCGECEMRGFLEYFLTC